MENISTEKSAKKGDKLFNYNDSNKIVDRVEWLDVLKGIGIILVIFLSYAVVLFCGRNAL